MKTNIKVNATILEDGLVEELEELIKKNPEIFKDSEVALMPDAHKTGGIPVGFTMTTPHYIIAPDFISADVSCGMTSLMIKDYIPSDHGLKTLSFLIRDLVQVNRRYDAGSGIITDLGTLGNGNHFVEIGVCDNDTLITVHSGSRNYGAVIFKRWKLLAQQQHEVKAKKIVKEMLENIEPKDRQQFLKDNKLEKRNVDYLDLTDANLRLSFQEDYEMADNFAYQNRCHILEAVAKGLMVENDFDYINTTHNYIDFNEDPWVIRKGSIKAVNGEQVIIPINMKDGIILGTVTDRGEYNNSLPHGAGRILSRKAAHKELDLEQFKDDMKDIVSPTVGKQTLDESPRAYKDIDTILNDIGDGLTDVKVFKSVFNYKGV